MKKYADQKCRLEEWKVGDMVLVKLQPYKQHSIALRKNQKLSLRYFGPFQIIERVGPVAYKLLLPSTAKIHPVFHASQLKLCRGDHIHPYVPLPITTDDSSPVIKPTAILKSRVAIKGSQQVQQHLIQWEGMDESQSTWEHHSALQKAYPDFNLEDKVVLNGGGIVSKSVRAGVKWAENGMTEDGHVAVDPLHQERRKSSRPPK